MISFLEAHGLRNVGTVHHALPTSALYEAVVRRGEGIIGHLGPLVVRTGHHTGRSPKDKFIVREPSSEQHIWWGDVNVPMSIAHYSGLRQRMLAFLQGKELFVQDVYAGADRDYRTNIRIITQYAWHSIFARNLFILPKGDELSGFHPEWVVIHAPGFHADPEVDGTNSEAFIVVNFGEKTILIGGTSYGGEIKKSIFTILNYTLPSARVLSMHCSANIGAEGDSALFFGLSGTGKTTLSADPSRMLIGDDEHGWGIDGIFNFEGGCYAKVIRLSQKSEPEIYATTRRFGTLLENVMVDARTRRLDLDDDTLTENTRAAYPISHMPSAKLDGLGPHPKNVLMLTCDAFGIMPAVSKLTPEQAVYHFLCGYTAKVAGTERGMGREPQAVFSTCFGAPFMARHPSVYAELLHDKIHQHGCSCWLVNTGWQGGPYGVGHRISIEHTRAIVAACLDGSLEKVEYEPHPILGLNVPRECPGVPREILRPGDAWDDPDEYRRRTEELIARFGLAFAPFADSVSEGVRGAAFQPSRRASA
jgi:phosphoenolpyruvate carboxykinase (ATP)